MWSTTPRRLIALVEALLNRGMPESMTVRELQLTFRQQGIYPARDDPQYCVPAPPDAFFSYHSAQRVIDIETIVVQACQYAARTLTSRRPDLANEDLTALVYDGIRIWVDFLFIDQSARDIREELTVLPRLLKGARAHFVLGAKPLMRAWCCYEIALFNQHLVGADVSRFPGLPGAQLRSFIAPTRSFHLGWDRTETTEPDDKAFIGERIETTFPGGFEGFNHIMSQANSVAVLPLAEGGVWSTPGADENLFQAVEAWYARSASL
jgi:hypothetical protein